ncbi:hypothetical protein HDU93_009127 [Gonapodya sp. JEL0774]|nr:hypothetical protein HDU93_009127 [Gonapodya sp. JEL0774]
MAPLETHIASHIQCPLCAFAAGRAIVETHVRDFHDGETRPKRKREEDDPNEQMRKQRQVDKEEGEYSDVDEGSAVLSYEKLTSSWQGGDIVPNPIDAATALSQAHELHQQMMGLNASNLFVDLSNSRPLLGTSGVAASSDHIQKNDDENIVKRHAPVSPSNPAARLSALKSKPDGIGLPILLPPSIRLDTPEDIAKWLADRKKHWPSDSNVKRKMEEEEEKRKRGELVPRDGRGRDRGAHRAAQAGGGEMRSETRFAGASNDRPLCKYFQRGRCQMGRRCRFSHIREPTSKLTDDGINDTASPARKFKDPAALRKPSDMGAKRKTLLQMVGSILFKV